MKYHISRLCLLACVIGLFASQALAATKYSSGAKTWNNSLMNWGTSSGGPYNVAQWNAGDSAVFEGTGGAVTLGEAISISNMSVKVQGYTFSGGSLSFEPGGVISNADNRYWITISSPITGDPAVHIADYGVGNQYKGIIFSPSAGVMSLGTILNPAAIPGGNTDKGGVDLSGSTPGNTAESIDRTGGNYSDTVVSGTGEWTVGDITTGTLKLNGGTLIVNGTILATYGGLAAIQSGARLAGNVLYDRPDSRSGHFTVNNGGIVSPGDPAVSNGVGTITLQYGSTGTPQPVNKFLDGSIYEWDVGLDACDVIHIVYGANARTLDLDNFVLKIRDAGGAPKAADQLPVFTYDTGVTVDLSGFGNTEANFDTSEVTAWAGGELSLVDDGAGTIYLTGLNKPPSGMVLVFR